MSGQKTIDLGEGRQIAPVASPVAETASIMQVISNAAADPATDVAKLDHLLKLYERLEARQAERAFNAAFAKMQGHMPIVTQRGEIEVKGSVQSRYARFEDINDAVKPVLVEHGFGVNFGIDTDGNGVVKVSGTLRHEAGHSETTGMSLPPDTSGNKNNVQSYGSSVSYAKRYVLCAMLNITTRGDDTDGRRPNEKPNANDNAATAKPRGKREPEMDLESIGILVGDWRERNNIANPLTKEDKNRQMMEFTNWATQAAGRSFDPSKVDNWTKADYDKCCEALGVKF